MSRYLTLRNVGSALAGFAAASVLVVALAYADIYCGGGTCNGTDAPNDIIGSNGHDEISAKAGKDSIIGNDGSDDIHGNADADEMAGGNARDWLNGDDDRDDLFGGDGPDNNLIGDQGNDYMNTQNSGIAWGNDDDDLIETYQNNAGTDSAHGGTGDDTCWTDPGDNRASCEHGGTV